MVVEELRGDITFPGARRWGGNHALSILTSLKGQRTFARNTFVSSSIPFPAGQNVAFLPRGRAQA